MREKKAKSALCAIQELSGGQYTIALWYNEGFVLHVARVKSLTHAKKWLDSVKERNPTWDDIKNSKEWVKAF